MLENACYSVITPEGCAAILWREAGPDKAAEAAAALKLSAQDLKRLGVIDEIIPEPAGGAQRAPASAINAVGVTLNRHLERLCAMDPRRLRETRQRKFAAMGRASLL
jgi:acetyl-CoA carboxylase carboxyl transferase subunit alpha